MWTVTLDSNNPIVTDQHPTHGGGRSSLDTLVASKHHEDGIENLIRPSSPARGRSSSLSRRPPQAHARRPSPVRSRSGSISRPKSPDLYSSKSRWEEEREREAFEIALENSVSSLYVSLLSYQENIVNLIP